MHKAKATIPAEIATEELFEVGSPGAVITDVAERVRSESHCHGLTRSGNLCRCSFRFGQHVCTGTYEDSVIVVK